MLKKPPTVNKKILTTPKLGPKKTVSVITFRIALTVDVKILWFVCQVAVCVNKRYKSALFGCSQIQKLNFNCLLHRLLICLTKTGNIFIVLLYNFFMIFKNGWETLKYFWRGVQRFWYAQHICLTIKKNPPEAAKVAPSVKFLNVETI